jgi:hypothetical protein
MAVIIIVFPRRATKIIFSGICLTGGLLLLLGFIQLLPLLSRKVSIMPKSYLLAAAGRSK